MFKEMEQFIQESNQVFGIHTVMLDGKHGFKTALEQLVKMYPKLQAVFLGIRRNDPHGSNALYFERTTPGWPDLMRVNPILDWDFRSVWAYILGLKIPYCTLYDKGYTSLGRIDNTQRNPALRIGDTDEYLPAYLLKDSSKERESRKPPAVPHAQANDHVQHATK
jgi:FAD synthetase